MFIRTTRVASVLCPVLEECLHFLVTSCKIYWFVELKCKIYGCPSATFVTSKSLLAIISFFIPCFITIGFKRFFDVVSDSQVHISYCSSA